MGEDFSPN